MPGAAGCSSAQLRGNTCAKVVEVGQFKGPPPYYGNPKVFADIYDLRTGTLKKARARLPVPGTYKTWRRIPPPPWASELGSEAESIPRHEAEARVRMQSVTRLTDTPSVSAARSTS